MALIKDKQQVQNDPWIYVADDQPIPETGDVIVGNIGTESRAKYGIVGSPVNLTDRIQHVAGYGRVVISEATYNTISACVNVSDEFVVCLKGVEEDQKLYEVESVAPGCAQCAQVASA